MSDIRVGVIGVGYLGKFHAKIYSNMSGVDLVGIVDVNAETAQNIAQEYNCKAYTDSKELLDKVDAVSIVVPTVYHLETARPFLEKGIHMLMEKPVAPDRTPAEVEECGPCREGPLRRQSPIAINLTPAPPADTGSPCTTDHSASSPHQDRRPRRGLRPRR